MFTLLEVFQFYLVSSGRAVIPMFLNVIAFMVCTWTAWLHVMPTSVLKDPCDIRACWFYFFWYGFVNPHQLLETTLICQLWFIHYKSIIRIWVPSTYSAPKGIRHYRSVLYTI